jgi:hypothetical protein
MTEEKDEFEKLKKRIEDKVKLELKVSSWENLLRVVRNSNINSEGNFWATIQHLESQLAVKSKEAKA